MPANKSLRLLLLEGVGAFLVDTINGGSDYTHILTDDDVVVGAAYARSDSREPVVCVYEAVLTNPDDRQAQQAGGNDDPALYYMVRFEVSGWGKKGLAKNPADMTYELMADVKKAFGNLDQLIKDGGLFNGVTLADVTHDPGTVLPATSAEGRTLNPMFVVQLGMKIVESAADPYRLND